MDKIAKTLSNPLSIVLVVLTILFMLFGGGALMVTLEYGGMMGSGWGSGISWMWIPALLFLTLSIMIGWVMKTRMKDVE